MRDPVFQLLNELALERTRQEEEEGFTPEHDDGLDAGELPMEALGFVESLHSGTLSGEGQRGHCVHVAVLMMRETERIDRRDGRQTPLDRTAEPQRFRRSLPDRVPP